MLRHSILILALHLSLTGFGQIAPSKQLDSIDVTALDPTGEVNSFPEVLGIQGKYPDLYFFLKKNALFRWQATDHTGTAVCTGPDIITGMAYGPDGTVYKYYQEPYFTLTKSSQEPCAEQKIVLGFPVHELAVSPLGNRVAVASYQGMVKVLDQAGAVLYSADFKESLGKLAFSSNEELLLLFNNGTIRVQNIQEPEEHRMIPLPFSSLHDLDIDREHHQLGIITSDTILVWNYETNSLKTILPPFPPAAIRFCDEGKYLLLGGDWYQKPVRIPIDYVSIPSVSPVEPNISTKSGFTSMLTILKWDNSSKGIYLSDNLAFPGTLTCATATINGKVAFSTNDFSIFYYDFNQTPFRALKSGYCWHNPLRSVAQPWESNKEPTSIMFINEQNQCVFHNDTHFYWSNYSSSNKFKCAEFRETINGRVYEISAWDELKASIIAFKVKDEKLGRAILREYAPTEEKIGKKVVELNNQLGDYQSDTLIEGISHILDHGWVLWRYKDGRYWLQNVLKKNKNEVFTLEANSQLYYVDPKRYFYGTDSGLYMVNLKTHKKQMVAPLPEKPKQFLFYDNTTIALVFEQEIKLLANAERPEMRYTVGPQEKIDKAFLIGQERFALFLSSRQPAPEATAIPEPIPEDGRISAYVTCIAPAQGKNRYWIGYSNGIVRLVEF